MTDGDTGEPVDYFNLYQAQPQALFDISATTAPHRPPLTISIAALGGATAGKARADNNNGIYAVRADGQLVASGADLPSGNTVRTHRQMAVVLAYCLGAALVAAVNIDGTPSTLYEQAQRLGQWAHEHQSEDADD
jgi:hypothetical protein